MPFKLIIGPQALTTLHELEHDDDKKDLSKLKKVRICLGRIETNPKHPGLKSHKYTDKKGVNKQDVWESYVENNNPSAWRVFWHYGPGKNDITVLLILPHP